MEGCERDSIRGVQVMPRFALALTGFESRQQSKKGNPEHTTGLPFSRQGGESVETISADVMGWSNWQNLQLSANDTSAAAAGGKTNCWRKRRRDDIDVSRVCWAWKVLMVMPRALRGGKVRSEPFPRGDISVDENSGETAFAISPGAVE